MCQEALQEVKVGRTIQCSFAPSLNSPSKKAAADRRGRLAMHCILVLWTVSNQLFLPRHQVMQALNESCAKTQMAWNCMWPGLEHQHRSSKENRVDESCTTLNHRLTLWFGGIDRGLLGPWVQNSVHHWNLLTFISRTFLWRKT